MIPLITLLRKDLSQMKLHLHGHGGSGISKRLVAEVVPRYICWVCWKGMALSPSSFSEGLKKSARVPLESSLISLLKPKMLS